jgi:DNA-binding MurR/RpiR family transcriptional regulator
MGSVQATKSSTDVKRSIIWFDASLSDSQENINAQQLLRTSTNHLKTYVDEKECEKYIRSLSKQHRIILIVGGQSGQLIVPSIHSLVQVSSIFVYCMDKRNQEWTKTYKKVSETSYKHYINFSKITF